MQLRILHGVMVSSMVSISDLPSLFQDEKTTSSCMSFHIRKFSTARLTHCTPPGCAITETSSARTPIEPMHKKPVQKCPQKSKKIRGRTNITALLILFGCLVFGIGLSVIRKVFLTCRLQIGASDKDKPPATSLQDASNTDSFKTVCETLPEIGQ